MKNQKELLKKIRTSTLYKLNKIQRNQARFEEQLLRQDVYFFLEDDASQAYFDNLGWWNYQMTELNKFIYGDSKSEQQMGKRLYNYVNALIEDYEADIRKESITDDEALILLSMLKTIAAPKNYKYYLNVISLSSKYEDYGTALFYLEEALKNGFKDEDELIALEDTALLRITPEYNKLIQKYLKKARYKVTD